MFSDCRSRARQLQEAEGFILPGPPDFQQDHRPLEQNEQLVDVDYSGIEVNQQYQGYPVEEKNEQNMTYVENHDPLDNEPIEFQHQRVVAEFFHAQQRRSFVATSTQGLPPFASKKLLLVMSFNLCTLIVSWYCFDSFVLILLAAFPIIPGSSRSSISNTSGSGLAPHPYDFRMPEAMDLTSGQAGNSATGQVGAHSGPSVPLSQQIGQASLRVMAAVAAGHPIPNLQQGLVMQGVSEPPQAYQCLGLEIFVVLQDALRTLKQEMRSPDSPILRKLRTCLHTLDKMEKNVLRDQSVYLEDFLDNGHSNHWDSFCGFPEAKKCTAADLNQTAAPEPQRPVTPEPPCYDLAESDTD